MELQNESVKLRSHWDAEAFLEIEENCWVHLYLTFYFLMWVGMKLVKIGIFIKSF